MRERGVLWFGYVSYCRVGVMYFMSLLWYFDDISLLEIVYNLDMEQDIY